MAKLFLQEIVRLHGLLATVVSDRGPQIASTFWGQICNHLGNDRRMLTAFHPQTDGQTERMNASMEQYLWVFVNHQQDNWVQWLPLAEFTANNGVSETTKCTPFFGVQGTIPRMSFAGEPTKEQDHRRLRADQVQATMQPIHEHLQVEMRRSQAIQEEAANRTRIPAPIYRKEPRYDWMLNIYEPPDPLGSWIGRDWDRIRFSKKYPRTHTS
jgi:hypothetical protein